MALCKRLIARLDIKGSRLIKGVRFEGLRVLGDPCEAALRYADADPDADGDGNGTGHRSVPLPGTLALAGLALAAAWAATKRSRH